MSDSSVAQLVPVMAVFAFVFTALILWCFLSSCMGTPLRRALSNLWEYTILGAQSNTSGPRGARARAPFGEDEIWEMQARGRRG